MAGKEKLVLVSIITVAINVALVGVQFWYSGDWRPFTTVLVFYVTVFAACVALARVDQWRRPRRRLRKPGAAID